MVSRNYTPGVHGGGLAGGGRQRTQGARNGRDAFGASPAIRLETPHMMDQTTPHAPVSDKMDSGRPRRRAGRISSLKTCQTGRLILAIRDARAG
eukprot:783727-Prymnesium_polylepis.1